MNKDMNAEAADRERRDELERLRKEHERLKGERIRAESNLENLEKQLTELQAEAQREYGTADPEQLEKLLAEKRAENERMLGEYREHIKGVNEGLRAIEEDGPGE